MSGISPGSVGNVISAGRNLQAVRQAGKDRMIGGIAQAGEAAGQYIGDKRRENEAIQFLTTMGVPPEEAQSVVSQGPRFFTNFVAQKHLEEKSRATAGALGLDGGSGPESQHAGMGAPLGGGAARPGVVPQFDNAGQAIGSAPSSGGMDWGKVDPSAMEFLARQRAQKEATEGERKWYFTKEDDAAARAEKQRGAEAERYTGTLGAMTAHDTSAPFNPLAPNIGGFGKPGAGLMTQRAAKLGANADPRAMQTALAQAPKPVAPPTEADLVEIEAKRAQAERDLAAAEKDRRPVAPADPKPYKPMTREEQIAFDADRAKAIAGARPASSALPPDQLRVLRSKLSATEVAHLDGLAKLLTGSLAGEDEQKAYDTFVEKMVAAHPDGAVSEARDTGADAGTKTAVDPSAKSRFDALPPEKKAAFLSKATPEQRAQVGQ